MKLYMKQKVFSWVDRFTVWDEYGGDRYYVEGELFSWGKRLHVSYPNGGEAAFIQQKVWSFLPRFFVFCGERQIAEIVREFTFFRQRYTVEGPGWRVEGDFWAHDYTVFAGGTPIAVIHKQWMTWGDCYELDIADPRDEIAALSVVLAIDCAVAQQQNN